LLSAELSARRGDQAVERERDFDCAAGAAGAPDDPDTFVASSLGKSRRQKFCFAFFDHAGSEIAERFIEMRDGVESAWV
jgi:hypothetical protein